MVDCSSSNSLNYLEMMWGKNLPFTWMRITVPYQTLFGNISLSLTNFAKHTSCNKVQIFEVDEKNIDIHCDVPVNITSLKLEGDVHAICKIFINGGRNLALFQSTLESSTYRPHSYGPQYAVDGRIVTSCLYGGCSHTDDSNPFWLVKFDQNYYIYRFLIYNRADMVAVRLKHFKLEVLDNNNSSIYSYTDNEQNYQLVYNVLYLDGALVAAIKISQTNVYNFNGIEDSQPYVSLNEFEAYGECISGTWDLNCARSCPSSCTTSCHVENGKCSRGCIGYRDPPLCSSECTSTTWGVNCLNNCSESCLNAACDNVNGLCLDGCLGYQDFPYCTKKCSKESYGLNCANTCSSNCLNFSCDFITGKCFDCKPGYTGDYCNTECMSTYFGSNCKEKCSAQCSQNICYPQTGRCLTCYPGFKGEFCNIICESKYFGQNCSSPCSPSCIDQLCDRNDGHCLSCNNTLYGKQCNEKCSNHCLNVTCDVYTGKCVACKPGYVGDFCDTSSDVKDSSVSIGVGVGVGVAVVLLVVIGVVLYKRRVQQPKQKPEAGVVNVVKSQEEDHYDKAHPEDHFVRDTTLDHYDIVLNEEKANEKVNESQYEIVSIQNQYDKLTLDIEDTSKVEYQKIVKSK